MECLWRNVTRLSEPNFRVNQGISMSITISVVLVLLLALFIRNNGNNKKKLPYPPGPKYKLLIGNLLDFPRVNASTEYVRWGKTYKSNIVHGSALGSHVIVINDREDADELFERRAMNYSDRPEYPLQKLLGWEFNMAFLRYGDKLRKYRRICQQLFHREAVKDYHPVISSKVHKMLEGLLSSPEKFEHHNKMLSISVPLSTMYGYEVESLDDPCVSAADQSTTLGVPLLLPGGSMINILPILARIPAWFPGASSRKLAAKVKDMSEEMQRIPLEFVKKRMAEGTAVPSVVSNFLDKRNTNGASEEDEEAILSVAATVYLAASDTTISATGTFFYLIAISPEIQKEAQSEIDRVVGFNRLPEFSDRASLPYLEALYREVLRWRPPVQLGLPHCISEDDIYNGYLLPKGATIFGNIWAMTHDENVYKDPFAFNPDRFFDSNGKLNDDDRILAYGFGRRICAGKHVASSTLWLAFASILAVFNITKAKDSMGNEIEIDDQFDDFGLLNHKTSFKCSITPRSAEHKKLIEDISA